METVLLWVDYDFTADRLNMVFHSDLYVCSVLDDL